MEPCPICQHAKRDAINADIARQMLPHRITFKYHINIVDLARHQAHLLVLDDDEPTEHQQNCMLQVPPACAEAISVGSQRLANCERVLVEIMDRLDHVLGNDAGLHTLDMHDAEQQFRHAWHAVKDDAVRQQRMITWLNEQIQSDDMGLP